MPTIKRVSGLGQARQEKAIGRQLDVQLVVDQKSEDMMQAC
jgi:hypothetical protein